MSRYGNPRDGVDLTSSSGRPIGFTLYVPEGKGLRSPTRLLASDAWDALGQYARSVIPERRVRETANAFLTQSHGLYTAARSVEMPIQPLLYYYSFLNLAKVAILLKYPEVKIENAIHGMGDPAKPPKVRKRFALGTVAVSARVKKKNKKKTQKIHVLNRLCEALGYKPFCNGKRFSVRDMLSQVPSIHRAYCESMTERERILAIHRPSFLRSESEKTLWARLLLNKYLDVSELTMRKRFNEHFRRTDAPGDLAGFRCFESKREYGFKRSAIEVLPQITKDLRSAGLRCMLTRAGYHYYAASHEPKKLVPQVVATYVALFYFSGLARYSPEALEALLQGKEGWAIRELLSTETQQWPYLLASEVLQREVVRPYAQIE